jgi:hypothetical protein
VEVGGAANATVDEARRLMLLQRSAPRVKLAEEPAHGRFLAHHVRIEAPLLPHN